MTKRAILIFLSLLAFSIAFVPAAQASFGFEDFDLAFTNQDGSPATQAGSHPFAVINTFHLNREMDPVNGTVPDGQIKDLEVNLPNGLVGDADAIPRCPSTDFINYNEETKIPKCPNSSAVGVISVELNLTKGVFFADAPVYDLVPPPGVVQKLGFIVIGVPVVLEFKVNPDPPYNVVVFLHDFAQPLPVLGSVLTLWGDPGDPAHDFERGNCVVDAPLETKEFVTTGGDCPPGIAEKPFITMPRACSGPLESSYEADPWPNPGDWVSGSFEIHDDSEPPRPLGMTGCGKLGFGPTISSQPTTVASESPTGLVFGLNVNDEGLTSSSGLAQSDIKKVVVTLPETMSANPAIAEGLVGCSEAQYASETVDSEPGTGCPDESKIGTVEIESPLIEQTLKGSLFLATPDENQFHSLLALYVIVKNPETGIFLKLPGKLEPNATTGQLVSVFDDLPQLPFSHFRLNFNQGQRSPLVSPAACGTYTTHAQLTPWSDPGAVLNEAYSFQVTTGIGGSPCPAGGTPPFKPGLIAGTLNNSAGTYSPLDVRITRNDGEQEITGFSSLLPAGLTANLSGVPLCSEADIALAKTKTGAQEESSPSCPVASEIGHTLVGVGVGSILAYTSGKLYMAGAYDGAPFSVVAVTAAKVGPFDLGTVVVHLPLQIDPITAAVSITSGAADQIPHIIDGIVIHVRDVRVYVDRPDFVLNPTNCSQSSFGSAVIGSGANLASAADDVPVDVNDPFEVANCARLAFKPSFKASTAGKTSRTNGASLSVKLDYPKAPQGSQADIRSVKVDLPRQLPSRLTTLQKACTSTQFQADPSGCPAASRVGHATAITPILPVALSGPAYFVSYGGAKFPELVIVLQGYGVTIDLHGETFISKAGITSSTFRTVPDQPVTSFELTLPQGKYSALAANGNLCATKLTMPTAFTAHNNAVIRQSTPVAVTGCIRHRKAKQLKKPSSHHSGGSHGGKKK